MRWCAYVAVSVVLVGVLSGCAINDPTENEFAPDFINDTAHTATVAYCNGASSCRKHWWTMSLRPGERTSSNINAGRGNLSVFLVEQSGRHVCIRLARYVKTVRLSTGTSAACHAPYD